MNKAEIATVERLRREGKELSAIAQETGISINTIKSHCSRHGIPAPRLIRTCMFCHSELKTSKRFCSDACRTGWYESHRDEEQNILHVCIVCGTLFEPRPAKQVYCSKQCFYNDRYHSKQNDTEYEINQELLQSISPETAAALVKMTMDYLLKSGWSPPEDGNDISLSAVIDAIYTQNHALFLCIINTKRSPCMSSIRELLVSKTAHYIVLSINQTNISRWPYMTDLAYR